MLYLINCSFGSKHIIPTHTSSLQVRGSRDRNRMVVVSWNRVHGEVYLIQHYVTKFVSDLLQDDGFLRVHRFPPLIKLTATI